MRICPNIQTFAVCFCKLSHIYKDTFLFIVVKPYTLWASEQHLGLESRFEYDFNEIPFYLVFFTLLRNYDI